VILSAVQALTQISAADGLPLDFVGLTADGCRAQQNGLDSDHEDFFLRGDVDLLRRVGPGFVSQPCPCHTILRRRSQFAFVNEMFSATKEMANGMNTKHVRRLLTERGLPVCPPNVETGWTCRERSCTCSSS
jgi:hypothetical protein